MALCQGYLIRASGQSELDDKEEKESIRVPGRLSLSVWMMLVLTETW